MQTAASVNFVFKLEKREMESIKLYKSNDLVSGIFSSSEVLKKKVVLNIFSNSKKIYLVKFATI